MKPQRTALHNLTLQGLHDWMKNHSRVLGGQVSFGATTGNAEQDRNIQCSKASGATPGAANTEFAVSHGLGRVPVTFFGHTDNGGVFVQKHDRLEQDANLLKCTTVTANYGLVVI